MEWINLRLQEPDKPDWYITYTGADGGHVQDSYWRGPESRENWHYSGITHWTIFEPPK